MVIFNHFYNPPPPSTPSLTQILKPPSVLPALKNAAPHNGEGEKKKKKKGPICFVLVHTISKETVCAVLIKYSFSGRYGGNIAEHNSCNSLDT